MHTKIVEATNEDHGGINWGEFLVGRFDKEKEYVSVVDQRPLLRGRGWTPDNLLVLDLQTGEGAIFRPGGVARSDLEKHRVWVCPLFAPFLAWLYRQNLEDLDALPAFVDLAAPSAMYGHRRSGPEEQRQR